MIKTISKYIFFDKVPFRAFRLFKRTVLIYLGGNDYLIKIAKEIWIWKYQIGIKKIPVEKIKA